MPESKYPDCQTTVYSGFDKKSAKSFTVAEFIKEYSFDKKITSANLRFCADSAFVLYCANEVVATGPACVGGDFIGNDTPRENFYAFEKEIYPDSETIEFFARVRMTPSQICDYSKGRGGFMLSAIFTFCDGSKKAVFTDESWFVRKNGAYKSHKLFDGRILPDSYVRAECIKNVWNTDTAPIPVRTEKEVLTENSVVTVAAFSQKSVTLNFDKIKAGFVRVRAKTKGKIRVLVMCRELDETPNTEEIVFINDCEYRGFYLHSAGNIEVIAENESEYSAHITVSFIETYYPVTDEASIHTSDTELNMVLDTCRHTLKICRQTHHLDSPRHCEPMACTGDYYIESLMTLFSFGDMRLAEFDLYRTALMLEREDGRMFHTTYSLIWVKMLYDVYMITGNIGLLEKCKNALNILLNRFETYIGKNGLIETPPDYMFVDWIYIDGLSLHHPPKALGQTPLNMFYYGALDAAEKIFGALGCERQNTCKKQKIRLQKAINDLLFDKEKGIYFMGLNTPTEESLLNEWLPQNTSKRYYLKHANILAVYFGISDDETSTKLVRKIISNEIEGDCQPYFLHYFLEGIYRLNLHRQYTMQVIDLWKEPVNKCPKGLVEGFVAPEPSYSFDHSHAWGGTPLYSLPKALLGLEILTPGMKDISVSPSLLGLEFADIELPTAFGKVSFRLQKDKEPVITAPEQINIISGEKK